MNVKRLVVILSVFLLILMVFLFLEPKQDDSVDITFWTYEFDVLKYSPPKDDYPEKDVFLKNPIKIFRQQSGLKTNPFFIVSGIDPSSKLEYNYEGGYPSKNLFTELSNLKTKTMAKEDLSLLKKFNLLESSPKIELGDESTTEKILLIGEKTKDKSARYVTTEDFLITIPNYIIDKFTNNLQYLRHRQLLSIGEDTYLLIKGSFENTIFEFENHGKNEKKNNQEVWFQFRGKLEEINPNIFSKLDGQLKSISYDLYPDEELADGFAVANQLTSTPPVLQLEILTEKKRKVRIQFYESIQFKDIHYTPVKRSIDGWTESPAYIKNETTLLLLQILKEIKNPIP